MKPRTVWEKVDVKLKYRELTWVDLYAEHFGKTRQQVLREAVLLFIEVKRRQAEAADQ